MQTRFAKLACRTSEDKPDSFMNIVMFKTMTFQILISILLLSACDRGEELAAIESADRVLTDARIYTVDSAQLWAEALAIKDGRFLYVGDAAGVREFGDSHRNSAIRVDGR